MHSSLEVAVVSKRLCKLNHFESFKIRIISVFEGIVVDIKRSPFLTNLRFKRLSAHYMFYNILNFLSYPNNVKFLSHNATLAVLSFLFIYFVKLPAECHGDLATKYFIFFFFLPFSLLYV